MPPREPEPIPDWMRRYLEEYLVSRLALVGPSPRIERPRWGVMSELAILEDGQGIGHVVRFVRSKAAGDRLHRAHELAHAHHLPAPAITLVELSPAHFRAHGFGVVAERRLPGRHLGPEEMDETRRAALAQTLAAWHRLERARWGPPGRPAWGSFVRRGLVGKLKNRLEGIARHDPEYQRVWSKRVLTFAKLYAQVWDGGPPYALTHDKINPGNVLFGEDGEVYLLDIGSTQFGAPGKDLAAALDYFARGEADEADLKAAYFARVDPRLADHFVRFEPLYRLWHHLSRWAARARSQVRKAARAGRAIPLDRGHSYTREREAVWRWIERGLERSPRR